MKANPNSLSPLNERFLSLILVTPQTVCQRPQNHYERNPYGFRDLLDILSKKSQQALTGGGEERITKQHAEGKRTARERIERLLDRAVLWKWTV